MLVFAIQCRFNETGSLKRYGLYLSQENRVRKAGLVVVVHHLSAGSNRGLGAG